MKLWPFMEKRLASESSLLARANDWVPQVRTAAQGLSARTCGRPSWLIGAGRTKHGSLLADVRGCLARPNAFQAWLQRAGVAPNPSGALSRLQWASAVEAHWRRVRHRLPATSESDQLSLVPNSRDEDERVRHLQ
jgi:hypothetical protein